MNNAQLNYKFFFQLPKGLQLQSVFEEIQSFLEKYKFSSKRKSWNCFVSLFYRKKNYSKKWTSETLEKDTWSYC